MASGIEKGALLIRGEDSTGRPRTVAVDTAGRLQATMTGSAGGTAQTIAVDSQGRMLATSLAEDASVLDFRTYYTGCDRRFTIGDSTIYNLNHRVKALNSPLNVIRFISAVGTATAGYYLLALGSLGEFCRGVGVNESTTDYHLIIFGDIQDDFNLSRANCEVKGVVLDLLTPTNRVLDADVVYIAGDETAEGYKALDYDIETYISKTITDPTDTIFQIDFVATDVLSISVYGFLTLATPGSTRASISVGYYSAGAWTDAVIKTLTTATTVSWSDYNFTPHTGVSKFRITITRGDAGTISTQVRDVTILRDDT